MVPGAKKDAGDGDKLSRQSESQMAETRPGPVGSAGGSQPRWLEGSRADLVLVGGMAPMRNRVPRSSWTMETTSAWATVVSGLVSTHSPCLLIFLVAQLHR